MFERRFIEPIQLVEKNTHSFVIRFQKMSFERTALHLMVLFSIGIGRGCFFTNELFMDDIECCTN